MPWEKTFDVSDALDRAMRTFWSRGYEATSMQDLVECMGVNRGSLYATYGDKRALFLSALRLYDDRMRRRRLAELEDRLEPREAIRQLFVIFVAGVSETGDNPGCFLTNTALELAAHDPEIRGIVAHAQIEIEAFFARMIAAGQASGDLSRHLDPAATARGLLGSLIGLVVLTRSRPEKALLDGIVDDVLSRLG